MEMDVYYMILIVFATTVASAPLQNDTVDVPEPKMFHCYRDICRTDEPNEFCSDSYRMCRPCTDVIKDCLSPDLPPKCLRTCIRHDVEQRMKKLEGKTCPVLSAISNGRHNGSVTDTHKPGEVIGYYCDMGYKLQYDDRRECRPYGHWSYDSPKCERIKCEQPHPLRNGKWLQTSRRYVSGHILRAQCDQEFIMDGPSEWHCTDEGKWKSSGSPYLPLCFLQGKPAETYSCGIDDERKALLDEKVFSLPDQNKYSENEVLSEERHIPAPTTYKGQSKDQPVSLSNTDTPIGAQGPITVNVINNHTIQNTAINETIDRTDHQTLNTTADDNTSNVTNTTIPDTSQDDNAPVEESGDSCIPRQPESADATLQTQSELYDDTLSSQLESPLDTVSSQSELSGGALQRQTGSSDGTLHGSSESSDDGLTNQSGISRGILPSHQGFGATLPNQNESYSH